MDEKKPKEAPAAAPKAKEPPAAKAEKPSGGNNNLGLLIGIIVIGVILQLVAGRLMAPAKTAVDTEESPSTEHRAGSVDLNATVMGSTTEETPVEVLVNIAGTDGERFLKAALVMEYIAREEKARSGHGGKKEGGGHGEKKEGEGPEPAASGIAGAIKQRMPKYKNYLLETLSKMTMAELTAPETKERIRKDFIKMVNGSLPPELGVVKDIYFTQYIIQ
jgi:flagellar basal body-associated protein FliL